MNILRHGELILKEVDELPAGASFIEKSNEYIAAMSETSHHHVLESTGTEVYEYNGVRYLLAPEFSKLVHKKTGPDVHRTLPVKKGLYQVIIKKEYDYFAKKMQKVRD